jgi:hypothetical protein
LFLIGWFFKFFSSETAWPNEPKLGRKHLWAVLYKEYLFRSNSIKKTWPPRNWSIRNKNCLWCLCLLTDWDKMSNLYKRTFHRCFLPSFGSFGHVVSLGQMIWNLVRGIYGRSSIEIAHFVLIH